jgi:GH15 family glucan-1,4-alpha-glucosidase
VSLPIEDYALIGDTRTAALVGRDGSIDWFCVPRFDSPACFAALLGDADNGRWAIAPAVPVRGVTRAYRKGTLTLETTFACDAGEVTLSDVMLAGSEHPRIVRKVRCRRGKVPMRMEYAVRFDYGSVVPWLRRTDAGLLAIAGPDALLLADDNLARPDGLHHVAEFELAKGESASFKSAVAAGRGRQV